MTKGKPPPKKTPFMITHSRRTGKIILAALAILLVGGGLFFYLAIEEANKINKYENDWRLMPCENMKSDFDLDPTDWKFYALNDKGCI